MRTAAKKLIAILVCALIFSLSFSATTALAYWHSFSRATSANISLGVTVGGLEGTDALLDRLPPNTPQDVKNELAQLLENESAYVVDALIDAVVGIVDTPNYGDKIHVAVDIEGLFASGAKPIQPGAVLVYTVQDAGSIEYVIIHVRSDTWRNLTNIDELYAALSDPWSNVNMVSAVWMQGNRYTPIHAPVEYGGRYYLLWHSGGVGSAPDVNNAWFELPVNYEYIERNGDKYFVGSIVYHGGNYYYCQSGGVQVPSTSSWKWRIIPSYTQGSFSSGDMVYITDSGEVTFWQALRRTSQSPSPASARSGDWRLLEKGWIGDTSDTSLKPFYFSHNTYDAKDIVIFGVSPKLHYQYFRAKTSVPADQLPIISVDGVKVINEPYWESVFYDGHL